MTEEHTYRVYLDERAASSISPVIVKAFDYKWNSDNRLVSFYTKEGESTVLCDEFNGAFVVYIDRVMKDGNT